MLLFQPIAHSWLLGGRPWPSPAEIGMPFTRRYRHGGAVESIDLHQREIARTVVS